MPKTLALVGNMGPLLVMFVTIPLMWFTHGWNGKIKLVGSVCQLNNNSGYIHPECLPHPRWPLVVSGIASGNSSSMSNSSFYSTLDQHWFFGKKAQTSLSIFSFSATTFTVLAGKAIAVAMIGYMESMTIAKTVARTHPDEFGQPRRIDTSTELVALGMCNLVCSQFSGYPVTGSFSRTAVNADSGANTQLASVIAASFVGLALLLLTPILQYIPKLALASIVLVAIIKLIKLHEASFLWHTKRRRLLRVFYRCVHNSISWRRSGANCWYSRKLDTAFEQQETSDRVPIRKSIFVRESVRGKKHWRHF